MSQPQHEAVWEAQQSEIRKNLKYKIETGFPKEPRIGINESLGALCVGDESFFVPGLDIVKVSGLFKRHNPKKFTASTVEVDGVKGVRVWRVA